MLGAVPYYQDVQMSEFCSLCIVGEIQPKVRAHSAVYRISNIDQKLSGP